MKTVNVLLFVILIIIAIYILYKLIGIGELSRLDDILLIVLIAGSFLHSAIRSRIKKKQGESKPTQ